MLVLVGVLVDVKVKVLVLVLVAVLVSVKVNVGVQVPVAFPQVGVKDGVKVAVAAGPVGVLLVPQAVPMTTTKTKSDIRMNKFLNFMTASSTVMNLSVEWTAR